MIVLFAEYKQKRPYLFAVLMLGFVSQIAQVLLLRELLMVFHGNELSIGLILAAWLAWVGIGSYVGAFLVERTKSPLLLSLINSAGILLILPLTLLLIRLLRGFIGLPPGAIFSLGDMLYSCFLLMAPICLLLGAQFVLLANIWPKKDGAEDITSAGKTYAGEAAGNVIGGLIFTFLLVRYLNAFQIAFFIGLLMLCSILSMIFITTGDKLLPQRLQYFFIMLIVLITAFLPFMESISNWAYRVKWNIFSPQHELVETCQSKHGAIAVLKIEDQYSFFQSGHLIFSSAGSVIIG